MQQFPILYQFSRVSGNFVAQVYVRSESFDKASDSTLENFDENNFAEKELSAFLSKNYGWT